MNFSDILKEALKESSREQKRSIPDMSPMYEMFEGLVEAGFTEEQAMELLINITVAMMQGNME